MTHTDSAVAEWRGRSAVDSDGDKIGSIDAIYTDADTGKPEWLAVKTGMFGSKVSFVPITEARDADGDVRLPYAKQQVKDAPTAEADGELSQDEEAALYSHYGLDYSETRSDSGLPQGQGRETVGHDTSGPTTANAGDANAGPATSEEEHEVVLHEEEVVTEKRALPKERVRLDKDTVTEDKTVSEEVRKEQIEAEGDTADTGGRRS